MTRAQCKCIKARFVANFVAVVDLRGCQRVNDVRSVNVGVRVHILHQSIHDACSRSNKIQTVNDCSMIVSLEEYT